MQPPASPPLPPPASPGDSSRIRLPRWLEGSALLGGGLLAGLASFFPWVRESVPAMGGDPPYTLIDSPGTGNVLNALAVLVVPIALAVLGTVILCGRGWTPPPGAAVAR